MSIKEIAIEVAELVEKKNRDYGNSFDKTLEERSFIVEDSNDDSSDEISNDDSSEENTSTEKKESKEYSFDSKNDPHWLDVGDAELIAQQFGYEPSTPRTKIKAIKEFDLEVNV